MKTILRNGMFLIGIGGCMYGLWSVWQPLAFIVGGGAMFLGSVVWAAVESFKGQAK